MEPLIEGTAALPVPGTMGCTPDLERANVALDQGGSGGGPELGEFPDGLLTALTPEQGPSEHETLCDCTGQAPLQPALDVGYILLKKIMYLWPHYGLFLNIFF